MGARALMPRTILLVCQAFPPDSLVGALRAGNVARTFHEAGYRVVVVTAALPGEQPGQREWLPGVSVHTVQLGPRYRERLTRLLRRVPWFGHDARENGAGASPLSDSTDRRGSGAGPLRRLLLSLVWIPDDELRFVLPAYRAARRLLREHVDLVYTSAPSHSTNLVGLLLRRLHRIRWCAEFRDPWSYPQSVSVTPLVGRANAYLEKQCIRAADHLVTVTEQTADLYRRRLGSSAGKVVVVRNGIPALRPRPSGPREGPFRIVYSGNLYGNRDVRAFVAAIADVARESVSSGPAIAVDFYGAGAKAASGLPLRGYVVQHGVTEVVLLHDWAPHAEILRVIEDADLLLLFAQHQPLQVPHKLYEYLGTGVPILAIAEAHGETAEMLRQVGGHYLVSNNDPAEIAAALREAIRLRHVSAPAQRPDVLNDWLTARQMERLVIAVGP